MQPPRLFAALLTTAAALGAAGSAQAADPQIVSRLDGPAGTPFPAEIRAVAGDGRYLVLAPKSAAAAAQLGVPQPADPDRTYLRDRATGSTSEIALRAAPGGAAAEGSVLDLSNDAERILFGTADAAIVEELGLPPVDPGVAGYLVVAARAGGDLWVVRDARGEPVRESFALLSGDGTSALVLGGAPGDPEFAADSIQRAHDDGPTEVVLNRPDAYPYFRAASDDLSVILYERSLQPSQRPTPAEYGTTGTRGIGLATPAGSRIIAQGEAVEGLANPGGQCSADNLRIRTTDPQPLALSANGQRVSYALQRRSISQSPGDEGTIDGYSSVVAGPGGVRRVTSTTASELANQVWPRTLAATHDLFVESSVKPMNWAVPQLDDFGTGFTVRSASVTSFTQTGGGLQNLPVAFADDDRTVLWASATQAPFEGQTPPASLPYVYAEPVTGPLPSSGAGASLWSTGIPDTADLPSQVTWADCSDDGSPAPVGPATAYTQVALRAPLTASASAGKVKVDLAPAGYRRASKVTLEYRLFGFSYWRKTVTQGDEYTLPRPPFLLPVTLVATITPVATGEGPAPAPVVLSRSIFATR